jgi:hypothetical protein
MKHVGFRAKRPLVLACSTCFLLPVACATPQARSTSEATAALALAPTFRIDPKSCFPDAAIDLGTRTLNSGLSPGGGLVEGCRDPESLGRAHLYHRRATACDDSSRYEAHMFAIYAPVDRDPTGIAAHRHDFEYVVLYLTRAGTDDGSDLMRVMTHAAVSRHGKAKLYGRDQLAFNGGRVVISYFSDGWLTHALRPSAGAELEAWDRFDPTASNVVAWDSLDAEVRSALTAADFGAAIFPLSDLGGRFLAEIRKGMPAGYPPGEAWVADSP